MRIGNWLPRRRKSLILNAIATATLALIVACGGGGSDPTAEPTAEPTAAAAPTAVPDSSARAVPTATTSPSVAPTSVPTPGPTATATSTPEPTATPKPTATPTPMVSNTFDGFGFSIQLDQDSTFASSDFVLSGWTSEAADDDQGLVTFTYNGANVILFWEPGGNTPQALADSTYELQKLSKPDYEFTAINEGDLVVDGQAGRFGGFVFADATGENASGGLIGAWTCPGSGNSISLTATSPDSTALQIRFDRLVLGFECGV